MVGSDEDHDRSRRPGVEDRGWLHRSDTRWPDNRRSGDIVCSLHRAYRDEERSCFLAMVK
jgi:hypothetical protein